MKKFLLLAACFGLWNNLSLAQTFFSLQWELAEPTESFRDIAGTGHGVKGTYMQFVSPRFALSGSVGYVKWGPRVATLPGSEYKFIAVPLRLGMNLLLAQGVVAPYIGMGLGVDYLRARTVMPAAGINDDTSELKFGFSPRVGMGIHLAGPVGLNVDGSYNIIYTSDTPSKYFGFGVGLAVGM